MCTLFSLFLLKSFLNHLLTYHQIACIPGDFGDFTVTRKYRGVTYHIQVSNPDHVEKGVASMTVDGTAVKGNLIPFSVMK